MMIVLDCSIALAWFMPDEKNQLSQKVLDCLSEEQGLVPFLWHIEILNTLVMAERRKRIDGLQKKEILKHLEKLPIKTIQEDLTTLKTATQLAEKHCLTVYDAIYLQLALQQKCKLATLDKALIKAAEAHYLLFT